MIFLKKLLMNKMSLTLVASLGVGSLGLGATEVFALESSATVVGRFSWVPSRATQNDDRFGSVKNHNIHQIKVTTLPDGKYQLQVTMPEDLTAGASSVIVLNETSRRPDDNLYEFSGPTGKFSCIIISTWDDAGCQVEFYNLGPTKAQQQAFLSNKYKGTDREFGQDFLVQAFGAEPIGNLAFSNPEYLTPGHEQGNGQWNTTYSDTSGRQQQAKVTIDFEQGVYRVGSSNGTLTGILYDGNVMEGQWNMGGQYGWIKFKFVDQTFQGTWGMTDDIDHAVGYWNGIRAAQ